MKIMTQNSVYEVDLDAKTITGGVLGEEKMSFANVQNAEPGMKATFFDAAGNWLMTTSTVHDVIN